MNGTIYAQQTDLARKSCKGDWLFYLQSDEVLHEKYLDSVYGICKKYLDQEKVEGLLFNYKHFWGDYNHYMKSHVWYPKEIRIIRNHVDIHSYGDAQSFKMIKDFDGINYRTKLNARRLNVKEVDVCIYHYGWVRPPGMMLSKDKQMASYYFDMTKVERIYQNRESLFDYGNLSKIPVFNESHPEVMKKFMDRFDWINELHYDKEYKPNRKSLKHERWKYRILSWIEQNLCNGRLLFGYKNWKVLK